MFIHAPAIHHGSQWEQPEKFNPERFLNIENESSFFKEKCFIPFGGGNRICIGQRFALNESVYILAMILRRFSVSESVPNQTVETIVDITQKPKNGLPLKVALRN